MNGTPAIHLPFASRWRAEILPARPSILPARHFTYPRLVEEVERGALEVMIHPESDASFLGTFALGFRDPIVPSGIWSMPHPEQICALSGGYAYIVSTLRPETCTMLPLRPVLQLHPSPATGQMLFVGNRDILAWNAEGLVWEAKAVSSEGITVNAVEADTLLGTGWEMRTDREFDFVLDLATGALQRKL